MSQITIRESPFFAKDAFKKYTAIGVLVDENTRRFCYEGLRPLLPVHHLLVVQSGEENKNLTTCEQVWKQLTDLHFDRHSLLLVLGGGVLGDMGGFCASVFKRGIDFMLMPTTLLAQVDASIGGKTGVDFGFFKNHIGLFKSPIATLIATDFLATLPAPELRSGFAEIIKHCLISDRRMWDTIQKKALLNQHWPKLVRHSVKFKSGVVAKDPLEKGLRKILNFGHTLGHAIEGHSFDSTTRLLHGEAIAAGMVIEGRIAMSKGLIDSAELESIRRYIFSLFGKIALPDTDRIMPFLLQDKKNKGKEVLMALPKTIGKAIWDVPVSEKEIRKAVLYYQAS